MDDDRVSVVALIMLLLYALAMGVVGGVAIGYVLWG